MAENVTRLRAENEVYIGRKELAARLDIGLTTLDKFVKQGMPSHDWGLRTRKFRFSECERWLRERDRKAA